VQQLYKRRSVITAIAAPATAAPVAPEVQAAVSELHLINVDHYYDLLSTDAELMHIVENLLHC